MFISDIYLYIIGWLVDVTGSYATPFLVLGSLQLIGGILGLLVYILQRIKRTNPDVTMIEVNSKNDINMQFCSQETLT